jgi:hypothetical protein
MAQTQSIKIEPARGRDAVVARLKVKGVQVVLVVNKPIWDRVVELAGLAAQSKPVDVFTALASACESGELACEQIGPGCEGRLKLDDGAVNLSGCRFVFR